MIAIALIFAMAAGDAWQKLGGPAFERFAARTEAICPARQLRFVTPADLDWYQEDFVARLPRGERHRLVNPGRRRCAGRDGLACPTTATLAAMATTGQLDAFAAFACADPPPGNTTTVYPAHIRKLATTSRSASPAAGPTP